MRKNRESGDGNFFWMSYSDLMTSLFFIMFVLFIIVFAMQNNFIKQLERKQMELERKQIEFSKQKDELVAKSEELDRIREIEKSISNIDERYFKYDPMHKKHILNMEFSFPTGNADINNIFPDKRMDLLEAGAVIKKLILSFPQEQNIKYFIVVEGQASKDSWAGNNVLSYNRAESLINHWKQNNVGLDQLKNCEIVIAGSGEGGVPRVVPDSSIKNQRFLITIVPKIGKLNN